MADQNPLGKSTVYPSEYSSEYLFPIERSLARKGLMFGEDLPFSGYDRWTAFEVSWLTPSGKPQVRVAEFVIPANTAYIVESKSFKLYLNSFNQSVFACEADVIAVLKKDLSAYTGGEVSISLSQLDDCPALLVKDLDEAMVDLELIDGLDVSVDQYQPDAKLLETAPEKINHNVLKSHLLKTNCPITSQPDWATVYIEYCGKKILPESVLKYLISFREHEGYHENCVERIFCDILRQCEPESLTVYARYTRRGGLDINPYRTNFSKGKSVLENKILRGLRQ